MGPGFIPIVLGTVLVLVGAAIGLLPELEAQSHKVEHVMGWRGPLCITCSVLSFAFFGFYGGLITATFVAVFIAAMGDHNNTFRDAMLLAVVMVIVAVVIFSYGLQLQIPLFSWGA
jgi:hypothetical protein